MTILYSEKIAKELGFKNEGLGILSDFAEPLIVTKNTKGFFETKFAYSAKGYLADEIVKGAYIKQVVDESGRQLVFEIYETEHDKVESIIYVVAELKLFVDMKRSAYKETKLENVTVEDVAQSATTVCDPPINYRVTGDSMVKVDFEVEDTNPYDVLFHENGILNLTGAELLVREDELHFSDHIGKRKIIEIHENDYIDNLKIKRNNKEQVTRIIPVTTIRYDKVVKVDDRHSKETIEKKVYGKAVVSSKVKDKGYPVITKFVQYQNETTEEKTTKEFEKEQKVELSHYKYENVEALNKEAELFFSQNAGIDEPEMTVSFDGLGLYKNVFNQTVSVDLYDTVMIYTDEFPKGLEMQVVESEFDGTLEKVISIKLSTKNISMKQALDNINSGRVSEQRLQWEINQRNQNQILQNFIFNDKGQRLEFGSVLPDPKEYRENDIFFLNDDSIYRLVNGAWKFEVGLLSKAMIDDKLKELESQATEANQKAEQIQSESAKKLAEFEQQLKDLGLPTESIEQTLDQLRQQLDRVSSRTNATLDMIGNDGVTRYNKNLLKGEFKRTVDYDDGKTAIIANDGGFKKGQTYTISFEAMCNLLKKGDLTIILSPPNYLRPVDITVKPPKKRLRDIAINTVKKENTIETYQGLNKVVIQNDWYETINLSTNVKEDTTLNLRINYRDYFEDDLKSDRQFVWNNNHELLIESNL